MMLINNNTSNNHPNDIRKNVIREKIYNDDVKIRNEALNEIKNRIARNVDNVDIYDIKALFIGLSDNASRIRLKSMDTLNDYLEEVEEIDENIKEIFLKNKALLLSLYLDSPTQNAQVGIELLSNCFSIFPEYFDIDDHKLISRLVYFTDPKIYNAAAEFFIDTMPDDRTTTIDVLYFVISYYDALEFSAELLVKGFIDQLKELGKYGDIIEHLEQSDGNERDAKMALMLAATVKLKYLHEKNPGNTDAQYMGSRQNANRIIKPKIKDLCIKFGKKSETWKKALCNLLKVMYEDEPEEFRSFKEFFFS